MKSIFSNKKVLITGHTGFKGSWLSLWMNMLGADLYGISLSVPTKPSHFEFLDLNFKQDIRIDISKSKQIEKIINDIQPDFIFHLAAQPLVGKSYTDPLFTFSTNIMGTVSILDSLRKLKKECIAVIITSDKSYLNQEINRGYNENDKLGGNDPYSGSKGATELVIYSYFQSFFKDSNIKIGVGRAGNVIGGGDWAENRIIPDAIKSLETKNKLIIRNPNATRPWQHVLEPLSGYIALALDLKTSKINNGNVFNFGPSSISNFTVQDILLELKNSFINLEWVVDKKINYKEATLLSLDCSKAEKLLEWRSTLDFNETIDYTTKWYSEYFKNKKSIKNFSLSQIKNYCELAKKRKLKWINHY